VESALGSVDTGSDSGEVRNGDGDVDTDVIGDTDENGDDGGDDGSGDEDVNGVVDPDPDPAGDEDGDIGNSDGGWNADTIDDPAEDREDINFSIKGKIKMTTYRPLYGHFQVRMNRYKISIV